MRHKLAVINGKFLSQKVTGVQRYAREVLKELDKLICHNIETVILADKNAKDIPDFRNIKVVKAGLLTGNLWEQITLPLFVLRHGGLCVSLCNMTPLLTPHIVVIHDVSFKVNKSFFSKQFFRWYNFVFTSVIGRIKAIITVSEFSGNEISRCYGVDREKITVTYNGWQHMENIQSDDSAPERYGITDKKYFFAMSSLAPNKNFRWIAEVARKNPGTDFAVSGAINKMVFGDIFDFDIPENLKFLGYVSDEEAKALMMHCRAFLFPTFYEGFGIPPLEALCVGAKAVVSDTSCMREIFGDTVYYIDPHNSGVNLTELIRLPSESASELFEKYSWRDSAKKLLEIILKEIEK